MLILINLDRCSGLELVFLLLSLLPKIPLLHSKGAYVQTSVEAPTKVGRSDSFFEDLGVQISGQLVRDPVSSQHTFAGH